MTELIAEIGINHDGEYGRLIKLSDLAVKAGADIVKIQIRTPELCVPKDQWNNSKKFRGIDMTYLEYKKEMEFSDAELMSWLAYMTQNHPRVKLLASVWDVPALLRYEEIFGDDMVKIPSAKIVDMELVEKCFQTFKTVMYSNGMSTGRQMAQVLTKYRRIHPTKRIVILDCHSAYPTPQHEVNLNRFAFVRHMVTELNQKPELPEIELGYSSHAINIEPLVFAMSMGASYLEFHITDDKKRAGSDHAASLLPNMVTSLHAWRKYHIKYTQGKFLVQIRQSELPALKKLR